MIRNADGNQRSVSPNLLQRSFRRRMRLLPLNPFPYEDPLP